MEVNGNQGRPDLSETTWKQVSRFLFYRGKKIMKKIVDGLLGAAIVCLFATSVFAQQSEVQDTEAVNKKVIELVDRMEYCGQKNMRIMQLKKGKTTDN